jgi:hypothetical protein
MMLARGLKKTGLPNGAKPCLHTIHVSKNSDLTDTETQRR